MAKKKTEAREGIDTESTAVVLAPEVLDQGQQATAQEGASEAHADTGPAAAKAQTERRQRVPLSQPVYRSELTLNSLQAQRVVHRSFAPLAGSLFRSDVILRIVSNDQAADELETIIRDVMNPVMDDLKKTLEQAQHVLAENEVSVMPDYTHVRKFPIEIKSPQTATFARMVTQLDRLIACFDALWFNGILTNKQRSHQTKEWQQRLLKMANRIIDFEKRARRRAYDAGKQAEVDLHAPQADQDAAETQIAEALQESEDSPNSSSSKDREMAEA